MPPENQAAGKPCLFVFVFTLLVSNTAAGLTGRLAGSLAFTTAAGFGALAEITCFDGLDSLHSKHPPILLDSRPGARTEATGMTCAAFGNVQNNTSKIITDKRGKVNHGIQSCGCGIGSYPS